MAEWRGKKVFIMGGSAGIGRASALDFVRRGASVAIGARGQARIDEAVAELTAAAGPGQRVAGFSVDVADAAAVRAMAPQVLEALGGLDVLICNSGYAHAGALHEVPDDDFRRLMDVNYLGHVWTVRAFMEHFMAQRSGRIFLVSSMLGFMSVWGYGAYSASKYAIIGFAEALRQEMALFDVGVQVFYPPTTKTPGLEKENEDKPALSWAIESESGWNKTYEAEEVADAMRAAIERGKFHNVVGRDSWIIYTAARHLPGITHYLSDGELKKAAAKVASRTGS
jgi:NAD(P)-dependent dehydrogenase (short-subunit alcohol dehydrogenase family)